MNWHNLSEQEFDEKLKEHLAKSNVLYDPASWDKMTRKLDVVFPANNSSGGRIIELVLVALLLSSLFFWNVGNFPQRQTVEAGLIMRTEEGSSMKDLGEATEGEVQATENFQAKGDQARNTLEDDAGEGAELQGAKDTDQVAKATQGQDAENIHFNTPGTTGTSTNANPNSSTVLAAVPDSNPDPEIDTFKSPAGQAVGAREEKLIKHPLESNGPHTDPLHSQQFPESVSETELLEDPPVISQHASPWFIGFGYAPDLSLVGFGELTRPGNNFSVWLEYRLGSRWSINTGLTYSSKKYKASGEDYNPPEGFWDYYGAIPDGTDATCDVLDIPINLRYYFNPVRQHRFFASTGLSSYIMLTEDYEYYNESGYNPDLIGSWSVRNENQHYFGIYNFSIGYQKAIGSKWYFEVEPFIKVPLSGVGFGDVELWSTGSAFSLKYNFR